jgi:hypothetical protein
MAVSTFFRQIRDLAWVGGATLAATFPLLLVWRAPWARGYALMIFFLGCTIAAANHVGRAIGLNSNRIPGGALRSGASWSQIIGPLASALIWAAAVFSALCWALSEGVEDPPIAPMLAFMSLVPAIGVTPYFVLTLRRRLAAVVFTVALVGCMKFVGAIIVVLIYGWDADEQGRLGMPWHRPDLLVWLFWSFTTALSLTLSALAARKYHQMYEPAQLDAAPMAASQPTFS